MITGKNKMVIIITVFVIIVCAITSQFYHIEHYVDDKTTTNKDLETSIITAKSLTYFPYISDFVHTNLSTNLALFTNDFKQSIMCFLPSYADGLCSWIPGRPSCQNYFINNLAFMDPYEYKSPIVCHNIESSLGMDKSQCEIRMLNNIYTLRKKCFRFTTSNGNVSFAATITSSQSITDKNRKLSLSHNENDMDLFALLRPNMISFGNGGLYKIDYLNTNSTLFSNFSSKNTTNSIVLIDVNNLPKNNSNLNIYPPDISLINKNNIMGNAYFINYEKAVYPISATTTDKNIYYNTINFLVDHNYLKTQKAKAQPIYTETITFVNNDSTATNMSTSLVYKFNVQPPASGDVPFFQLSINHPGSSSTQIVCKVHDDFTKLMYNYINKTDDSSLFTNNYINWHIVVVYSLDLVIILAMFRDYTTGQNEFYMTQKQIIDATPVYIQYKGDNKGALLDSSGNVASSILLNNHYKYFTHVLPNTIVPNLALVAKNLGYTI